MAGWSEGYSIPRLSSCDSVSGVHGVPGGDRGVLVGHGALKRTQLCDNGDDSWSHVRAEYSLIYSARCIYCKSVL